jgi:hypothetical protein
LVRVLAAAEPAATPNIIKPQVAGDIGMWYKFDAVSAAPNAVNTNKYQIFGFVSS